jgi:hypothetical protein
LKELKIYLTIGIIYLIEPAIEFEVQETHCADKFLPIIYELKGKKQQGYLSFGGSLRYSQEKQESA